MTRRHFYFLGTSPIPLLLGVLALVLALPGTPVAAREVVAGLHDAHPVAYRAGDGSAKGFAVDVLEAIARERGWTLRWRYGTWKECMDRLRTGEIDLLFPMTPTPEREKDFEFTEEGMFPSWGRIFTLDATIESILDLDGKKIGMVEQDIFGEGIGHAIKYFPIEADIRCFPTTEEVIDHLLRGEIDAASLETRAISAERAREDSILGTPIIFSPVTPRVAFARDRNADLRLALDEEIAQLKEDPDSVYHRAVDRWILAPARARVPSWVAWVIGGVGLSLILALAFNRLLGRQVRNRTRELSQRNESLVREVERRERVEKQRKELEVQLLHSQKLEALGTLSAGVAHDFSNLLTVISAHTNLLRQNDLDERLLSSIEVVDNAVKQATSMTRSLLTLSRKLPVHKQPVDLAPILDNTHRMLSRVLPRKIRLEIRQDCPTAPWVCADESQIQQVLLNLAVNARDAMPDGGDLRIRLTSPATNGAGVEGSSVTIAVQDTGVGISEEMQPHLFEPFFSTKSPEEGTGLGLACVQAIVDDHQGRIVVESAPGRGSTFHVHLPRVAEPPPSEAVDRNAALERGRGELILLAEDQQQIRDVLASYLTSLGYRVDPVADGRQLAAHFSRQRDAVGLLVIGADIPLRDAILPLRTDHEALPVLWMAAESGRTPDLAGGRDFVLTHPFELGELGDLVHEILHPEEALSTEDAG